MVQIQATGQEEEHEDVVCGADTGYWTGGGDEDVVCGADTGYWTGGGA